ncbi:MAG: agmatine deiminase family protein [Bacteroidales bacterium]|jgi:agmatine deiminase|nr:agmatine deiminase family protein [Bacteroidales bacterium]
MPTPKERGFYFPAEWHKHNSTWLSYPHNENSFPAKIHTIFPAYNLFIRELAKSERVNINILDDAMRIRLEKELNETGVYMNNVCFHFFETNDAWCRDHGPAFLINGKGERIIVDWDYNAWGGKYPAEKDNLIPEKIAAYLDLEAVKPNIVMEGGSIDVNGKGTLLTTTSCLLNQNRNPHLNQSQIEDKLCNYYGVEKIIWLEEGIDGDDTDGHIDDMARFTDESSIAIAVETNRRDENYESLQQNLKLLKQCRLQDGKQPTIIELPMPMPVVWQEQRLPASYANFYISNSAVIVPTYRCEQDNKAIYILEECFKERKVVGIDSTEIIWGLGSFHCLSQQEPSA